MRYNYDIIYFISISDNRNISAIAIKWGNIFMQSKPFNFCAGRPPRKIPPLAPDKVNKPSPRRRPPASGHLRWSRKIGQVAKVYSTG